MEQFFIKPNELKMISRRFLAAIRASSEEMVYKKGDVWLGTGKLGKELLLLKSGCMIARAEMDAQEASLMLWQGGQAIIPAGCLFHETVSTCSYQFLSDARVFSITVQALKVLLIQYEDTQFMLNYYMTEEYQHLQRHSMMLAWYEPQDRIAYAYRYFREPFGLLNRDEQASFLGMTRRVMQRYL